MVKTDQTKRDKEELDQIEKIYIDKIKKLHDSGISNNEIRKQLYSMYKLNKKLFTVNGEKALKKVLF